MRRAGDRGEGGGDCVCVCVCKEGSEGGNCLAKGQE